MAGIAFPAGLSFQRSFGFVGTPLLNHIKSTTSKTQEHTMKKYQSNTIASMPGLNAPLKTKCKSIIRAACHSFSGAVCAGAVLLIASSAQAQNLFEADRGSGNIFTFTPGGVQTTFASGLNAPLGLAFNSAGNLFEADYGSGNIYEFTPGGAKSTFATGLGNPEALAFNSAGNLFVSVQGTGIYEFTPSGAKSTFNSQLSDTTGLAFDSAGNLFVSVYNTGNIYKITPGGMQSTFASGLNESWGLAFNSAGDLFEADRGSGNIYEFTPGGARSTFATGLSRPAGLAFQGETLPVPEPSALGLLAVGASTLLVCRRKLK
jgi:hypothetical protein